MNWVRAHAQQNGVKATACGCAPRASDWTLAYQGQGFAELLGAHAAEQPEWAARASPTQQISRPSPFLLIHGDEDREVPLEQSRVLHQALQQAGASSHSHVVPGGDHFINESHRSEVQAALLTFFQMEL